MHACTHALITWAFLTVPGRGRDGDPSSVCLGSPDEEHIVLPQAHSVTGLMTHSSSKCTPPSVPGFGAPDEWPPSQGRRARSPAGRSAMEMAVGDGAGARAEQTQVDIFRSKRQGSVSGIQPQSWGHDQGYGD